MRSPKAALKAIASQLLGAVPISVLQKAEDAVQKQLGKGSGAWSTAEEAKATSEFVRSLGLQEVIAIDAGANIGNWLAEFLKCLPAAQVIAFEPSKVAFKKLAERFANDDRVNCVNSALGKVNEDTTLYSDEGGSGLGSLTKRRVEHFNIDFGHQEKIQVQTLDSWINKNQVKTPNVLKMDIEGHEYNLLLGAEVTLRNIKVVQFEFGGSNIDTRTYFQDFWYFFKDLGFTIYRLTPLKPLLIEHYSESDESFRATNYVAIRNNA
jgi:FkbM family methyltransferase